MTFKNIVLKASALHTGEVVGSIPTAPTTISMTYPELRRSTDFRVSAL
jgi:hypothetical protein